MSSGPLVSYRFARKGHVWSKRFGTPYRVNSAYRTKMYKGGIVGRAIGSMKASKKGVDCSETVIQGMLNIPIVVDTTKDATYSNGEVAAIPVWQLLFNSEYWPKMKDLWEMVKITGIQIKILGNSAASTVLASGLSSVGVLVAIDRNGVNGRLTGPSFSSEDPVGTKRGAYMMYLDGAPSDNVNNALAYGSCKTKNWSPGNAFYQWISCYPSSMSEKDPWLSCDDGVPNYIIKGGAAGEEVGVSYSLGYPNGLTVMAQDKYSGSKGNYRSFGFDPVILLGVYNVPMVASTSTDMRQTFTFSMEFKLATVWRGPRGQKTDISNNVRLEPPSAKPQAITLNYTANTPEGGDVQEGLFNKVTVNVNVPHSEEIPEDLIEVFTDDTDDMGRTWRGLYDMVNITVKTKKIMSWYTYGTNTEKNLLTEGAVRQNVEGYMSLPVGEWFLLIFEDKSIGMWKVRFIANRSGSTRSVSSVVGEWIISGKNPSTGGNDYITFYNENTTEAERWVVIKDDSSADSQPGIVWMSTKIIEFEGMGYRE